MRLPDSPAAVSSRNASKRKKPVPLLCGIGRKREGVFLMRERVRKPACRHLTKGILLRGLGGDSGDTAPWHMPCSSDPAKGRSDSPDLSGPCYLLSIDGTDTPNGQGVNAQDKTSAFWNAARFSARGGILVSFVFCCGTAGFHFDIPRVASPVSAKEGGRVLWADARLAYVCGSMCRVS